MNREPDTIGTGPDKEFSLRISVAAIVCVKFRNPEDKKTLLALERTAFLQYPDEETEATVKAKPFGGGARLLDPERLRELIGGFNYDSEQSLKENDFRIITNPKSWEKIKDICLEHLKQSDNGILDTGPERELEEEFEDNLKIKFKPDDYLLHPNGMLIEDIPVITNNINAGGLPTVRIYYLYDAEIMKQSIIEMIMENSSRYSDNDLAVIARQDYNNGGKGRANAVLAVDPVKLRKFYQSLPVKKQTEIVRFEDHMLDANVLALFEDIASHKYQRIVN